MQIFGQLPDITVQPIPILRGYTLPLQLKRERRERRDGRRSNAEKSSEGSGSPLAAQYSWNRGSPRRKIASIDTLRGSIPSERRERFLIEPF